MGIDIHRKGNKQQRLFSINDELYDILRPPVFDVFEGKTGVFIDNYGTITLTFQHAKLLIQLLEQFSAPGDLIGKDVGLLIHFLDDMVQKETDLDFVGD